MISDLKSENKSTVHRIDRLNIITITDYCKQQRWSAIILNYKFYHLSCDQ